MFSTRRTASCLRNVTIACLGFSFSRNQTPNVNARNRNAQPVSRILTAITVPMTMPRPWPAVNRWVYLLPNSVAQRLYRGTGMFRFAFTRYCIEPRLGFSTKSTNADSACGSWTPAHTLHSKRLKSKRADQVHVADEVLHVHPGIHFLHAIAELLRLVFFTFSCSKPYCRVM